MLIENNEFADGHGGVALGSEMSGGIRCVLAWKNLFTSPNLTYALRLKTNAKRGGRVEDIILADSVMDYVHGAAIHGTMLYEDGRNGHDLPVFRNITIENITAHGGDYGIFLEAFEEVPITGLVLKNITIDGAARCMRSMNWKDPVIEQVMINGRRFPRPGKVRILGIPVEREQVEASAEVCGGQGECGYAWDISEDGTKWSRAGEGRLFTVPGNCAFVRATAWDMDGNRECSRRYRVLSKKTDERETGCERKRLACREILEDGDRTEDKALITREKLAGMLMPFIDGETGQEVCEGREIREGREVREGLEICEGRETHPGRKDGGGCLFLAVDHGFIDRGRGEDYLPGGYITRQEMATVAMQACKVNYRNASSTMPVCADADRVGNNYGTNVARALYFGFMETDGDGLFGPKELVTMGEAVKILNRVLPGIWKLRSLNF